MSQPNFEHTIRQFADDLCTTFPEYSETIAQWWDRSNEGQPNYELIKNYCRDVYPPFFMDIIYQNEGIFAPDAEQSVFFLPNIDFKTIWNDNISDTTKETIWKYLQLIAITIMGEVQNTEDLDTNILDMFKNLNTDDFQSKIQETMENLQTMFASTEANANADASAEANADADADANTGANANAGFDFGNFQRNMEKLMEGKIGQMARELAEETAQDLDIDLENTQDIPQVLKKLMSDPTKLMKMAKKVGERMKSKMDSGDMSEVELQAEIMELMKTLNPNGATSGTGMNGIKEMMSAMGIDMDAILKQFMGGGGGGAGAGRGQRMNMNKMNAMMQREQTRERMRANIAQKQQQKEAQKQAEAAAIAQRELEYKPMTDAEIELLNEGIARNKQGGNGGGNGGKSTNKKKKKK